MAKAKKIPSGQWRTLVYSHTKPNGKRVYESFTADTRRESEFQAAQFALTRKRSNCQDEMTVRDAVSQYVETKTNILSPSTIREYRRCLDKSMLSLHDIPLKKLTAAKIQAAVNDEALTHSPKYVKNVYGLYSAAIRDYNPQVVARIRLPQKRNTVYYTPNDDDIKYILSLTENTDLYIPIMLSAFLSLRRSEICGLRYADIDWVTGRVHVARAMVLDSDQKWVIKPPKTFSSDRYISMPKFLLNTLQQTMIGRAPGDYITELTPSIISDQFRKLINKNDLPHFRFHDLRHYNASVMLSLGMPDKYAMERGGWQNVSTMKYRYQHTFAARAVIFDNALEQYFEGLCNTKCNTK